MTTPTPGGNNRRRNGQRQNALNQQLKDVVDQMKTASQMLQQASSDVTAIAHNADQAFKSSNASIQMLAMQMQAMAGGQYGPIIGGTQTPGYNFNRPFMPMPGYGGHGGPGGGHGTPSAYPGPGNPIFGGHSHGGFSGGLIGRMQHAAGQYLGTQHGLFQNGITGYSRDPVSGRYFMHDANGNLIRDARGDLQSISGMHYGLRSAASNFGAGLASGEGILSAASRLPVVGTAMQAAETVYQAGQFIGDQRAANAQYQSIYGPGTSGWDQRVQNFSGRVGNFFNNLGSVFGLSSGGLTDSDYNKAWQGISAMGYQGNERSAGLNFATNNFNSMGMSVDESLQLIGVNAKQTSTNLATLSEQLNNVSTMAQQAGQSADVFRQKFIQTYSQNVANGLGGGSGALAVANTAVTAGMGRPFTGYNASSMYSTISGQQFLASSAGYSDVTSFMFAAQSNPSVMSQAMDSQIDRIMNQSTPPEIKAAAQQLIQQNGGRQAVINDQTGDTAGRIYQQLAKRFNMSSLVYAVSSGLASIGFSGVDLSNNTAVAEYWIKWVAMGGSMLTKQTVTQMQQSQQKVLTSKDQYGNVAGMRDMLNNDMMGSQLRQLGYNIIGKGKNAKVVQDPIVARLYKAGVKYVTVQTKNGPTQVSLDEAVKDPNYREQIVKGTALLPDGTSLADAGYGTEYGKTGYSDVLHKATHGVFDPATQKYINSLHLTQQQQEQLTGLAPWLGTFGKGAIKTAAEQMAQKNADSSGGGGTITLDLSADAKRLLNVSTTGNVDYPASNNSVPTYNPQGASVKSPGTR